MGSISGFCGALAGLLAKERLGIGQEIHGSILGGMIWLQWTLLSVALMAGEEPRPQDIKRPSNPVYSVYKGKDGRWLALGLGLATVRYWPRLCRAIGREDLEHDPRFDDSDLREKNSRQLAAVLAETFAQKTCTEWLDIFEKENVIVSIVNRPRDMQNDPQVIANEYITECNHPVLGPLKEIGYPIQYTKTPARISSCGPELGEHTEAILTDVLGYSWDEIIKLKDEGVIP